MPKLLLAGYFGCGNLGDDAILLGFTRAAEARGYRVSALSGAPEETYRIHGVPAVPRKDLARVRQAIGECDALVFPGGSIFQDVTSGRSVLYYSQLVGAAKKQGKKVILLGQGVGPLGRMLSTGWARKAFRAADAIAVRDPDSIQTLRKLGVETSVTLTADAAFLLPPPNTGETFQVGEMKTVGLCPRPSSSHPAQVVALFADLARRLFEAGQMPTFLELDREHDGPLIAEIVKKQGGTIPQIRKLQTPVQVQERLARMDAVISMRLHGGILAATAGVPPFMLSYDPKVTAFARVLGLGAAPNFAEVPPARLFTMFQEFQKERERHVDMLTRKRAELHEAALKNLEVLDRALGRAAPAPSLA